MASVLKVDTITGVTTAGSISVTGEGNSTTTNLQQGLAKVWSRWQGSDTFGINDSLNVTSGTDNGTGDYTMTFSSAMGNANYSFTTNTMNNQSTNKGFITGLDAGSTPQTGSFDTTIHQNETGLADRGYVSLQIMGDLA